MLALLPHHIPLPEYLSLLGGRGDKTAKTANAANGGGSSNNDDNDNDDDDDDDDDNVDDDDNDDDDDDDGQAAPADKWMNGKLFHWDPFFGWTSGCHWLATHVHRLACV